MAAKPSARIERIPPPPPSTAHAPDDMEKARELARRYMPDAVSLLASVAFAPDSEAYAAHQDAGDHRLSATETRRASGCLHAVLATRFPRSIRRMYR